MMSIDGKLLQSIKEKYDEFKSTSDYQYSLERKKFVSVIARPILDKVLSKDSINENDLTSLIQLFKVNCTVPTFEEKLHNLKLNESFTEEIIQKFKETKLKGYTGAGLNSINLGGQKEQKEIWLETIFKFLKDVLHNTSESEIKIIVRDFDDKNIPYITYGIYSPWLHYMHPTICPIVNGPLVTFLKNQGIKASSYTETWVYLKEINQFIGGSEDYGDIDYFVWWLSGKPVEKIKRYWMYAPGENAILWDEFYSKGIMAIGWDIGDILNQYTTKESIKTRLKEVYGVNNSYVNTTLALWQFANEIHPEDIVFVKKGVKTIVGRGIVKSEYIYDDQREEYRDIHKVEWTNKGEWRHPGQGQASLKTLTEITSYTDYVKSLENLFQDIEPEPQIIEPVPPIYPPYTKDDFLNDVFIDEEQYNKLVTLLKNKKNIILQGAPGVGKTFASKRLAYSIMGEKDESRVMMIQFHQSYSYEDFIIGFRPSEDGFSLARGPFYEFCKKAQDDNKRDYFFIIDEINRGNLSKILGELLMLIERDKRGEELHLLYSNEPFSVPKNVYIIGMMNTADRSLAMIDYALRRRFAFYELEPSFESKGFKKMLGIASNPKYNALVDTVRQLNIFIGKDESLGDGFRIGHSYLCIEKPVTDDLISSVIKYELIPLIKEYWFDEQSKIEEWSKKLYETLND